MLFMRWKDNSIVAQELHIDTKQIDSIFLYFSSQNTIKKPSDLVQYSFAMIARKISTLTIQGGPWGP